MATSRPCRPAALTRRSKSWIVPRSGWTLVWPPSSDPIAQGLPGSPGFAPVTLFRPLRFVSPIGWMGGMYRTSNPMPET